MESSIFPFAQFILTSNGRPYKVWLPQPCQQLNG
jgi:hypothetical protein